MKEFRLTVLFLASLTVLFGCKNENSRKDEIAKAENVNSEYVVDIEAIDYAFKMQSEVKSGWVTFDFHNKGHKMHFGMLLRFNKPIAKEDLERYYADRSEENFMKLMGEEGLTIVGGPGFHTQGQKSKMTIFLEPGDYLMSCNTQTVDGRPHYELGMEKFFKVTGEDSKGEEPVADLELNLKKYFIETKGELRAGIQTIAVNHAGGDSFDIHLVKLNDTSRIESALKFMDKVQSPSKVIFESGAEQAPEGNISYMSLDFEPGNYAWVSHEYGAIGMIKEFTIPQTGPSQNFSLPNNQKKEVEVSLTENGIDMPSEIGAGHISFVLQKNSNEEHALRMFRLEEGKSAEDFLNFEKARQKSRVENEKEFKMENPSLGYYTSFSDNNPNFKTLDVKLNPSSYVMTCLHRENEKFEHLFEGEITEFEVVENINP